MVVRSYVVEYIKEFHNFVNLPKAMISSFIALVTNSLNPQGLDDFRPICLIGCVYKFISKWLVARLKKIIGMLIFKTQTSFIPGRQLLDRVVLVNEIIDFGKRNKRSSLLFKIDFTKAYNCVDWKFLVKILLAMGFGDK